ncbi:pyridoxamine 5'-phosphate oxidase family protein [Streptomyces sp. NBC_01433]|uniref:pyridoxamine 5'-phosphate oxidase family protein n=1 Tax=Streptomyces sp. NBC_01433 TaxID=2903864 RepID=UPI002B1CCBF5|nr:pyridoxamine 5'-phosphate oxidase family protein [Streptomyces sp. NBC_01433]
MGRVALASGDGPVLLPLNYQVLDGEVMFSTAEPSPLARAAGTEIAFEADHIDDAFSRGWSVMVVGPVRAVTDADDAGRLRDAAYSSPMGGGRAPERHGAYAPPHLRAQDFRTGAPSDIG